MSLKNLRSGKIGPPPSKWDTEYVNRIRREIESHNGLIPNAPGQPMFLTFTDGINFTYGITGSAFDQGIVSGDNGSLLTVAYDTNYPFNHGIDKRPLVSPDSSISINVTDKVGLTDGQIQLQVSAYSVLSALSVDSIASDDYLPFEDVSGSDINKVTITDFFDQSWTSGALHYQEVQNAGSGLTKRRAINLLSPLEAADNGGTGLTELRLNASAADKYLYSTAADTWTEGSITTTGRSLVASASASAARDTLDASSGVWPATIGGTGLSSYTTGDLLYASASNTLSKLAAGTSGNFLKQGASVPSWAALAASDIASGQLALARGGTAADLSATGGTSQFLRQSSAGAAITVSAIAHADLGSGGGTGTKYLRDDMSWQTVSAGVTDHGALTGLADDDHTQYALLAGRGGGQTLIGGTGASENLTLTPTSHATKGWIDCNGILKLTATATSNPSQNYIRAYTGDIIYYNSLTTTAGHQFLLNGTGPHLCIKTNGGVTAVGIGSGLGATAAASALEVRSTSAQIRASHDATNYVEIAASSTGKTTLTLAGSAASYFRVGGFPNSNTLADYTDGFGYSGIVIGTGSVYGPTFNGGVFWNHSGTTQPNAGIWGWQDGSNPYGYRLYLGTSSGAYNTGINPPFYWETLAANTYQVMTGTGYYRLTCSQENSSLATATNSGLYIHSTAQSSSNYYGGIVFSLSALAYKSIVLCPYQESGPTNGYVAKLTFATNWGSYTSVLASPAYLWTNSTTEDMYIAPARRLVLEKTYTLTANVTDGYVSGLASDPGYTGAFTVTRHNYIDCQNVSLAASAAVTDSCLVRFDAAAGTHKAVASGTTKTTPGGVDAWVKININGTLYYVPAYTSTTA